MTKKHLFLISGFLVFSIVSFFLYRNLSSGNDNSLIQDTSVPSRSAEINGLVTSIEGNIVVINKEVGRKVLTSEEQEKRREEMQKLSPEDRQLEKQKELEGVTYEKIEFTIPVGVTVVKGSGDATGKSIPAELADIEKDTYLSIWLNSSGNPEYVKIKGTE